MTQYETPAASARRWGVPPSMVRRWLHQGRVAGAIRETVRGNEVWSIPVDAPRPEALEPWGLRRTAISDSIEVQRSDHGWSVVNVKTGHVHSEHETRREALDAARALGRK